MKGTITMKIIISNSSSIPIYEQIKQAIIEQILNNELQEDEALPSIRNLAQDIKISVMTIKKAYDELENEGYIVSRQGKGTFVAPKNTELAKEQAQKEIESYMGKIVDIAEKFQIKQEEIIELVKIFYGSDE
jgi:transcriptional regulator, GntR family